MKIEIRKHGPWEGFAGSMEVTLHEYGESLTQYLLLSEEGKKYGHWEWDATWELNDPKEQERAEVRLVQELYERLCEPIVRALDKVIEECGGDVLEIKAE